MNDGAKSTGAVALVTGGVAAAAALTACCAAPILLAGIGIGAGWLLPIAAVSDPHANVLTAVSAAGLIGGVAVVARAPRHCKPRSVCARPLFRWSVIAAAITGAVLLILSKLYA